MSIKEITLPEIGEGVTEGEMVEWLVSVGDKIEVDQPVAEMMTDKATVQVPTPFSGQVKELKVKKGDIVPIKSTLLVLDVSSLSSDSISTSSEKLSEHTVAEVANEKSTSPSNGKSSEHGDLNERTLSSDRVLATPATRRLAREMSIDLNQVQGTGLSGRVRREDVLQSANKAIESRVQEPFLSSSLPAHLEKSPLSQDRVERRVPLRGVRRKIALHMKKSKSLIPHFTLVEEASVSELVRLRKKALEVASQKNIKLTYLPFVIKALVNTVKEFPSFSTSLDEEKEEIVYKSDNNVGIAVSTNDGLMVPNIKDIDKKNILQIAFEIKEIAERARASKLKLEELKGGTITVTNLGSIGGLYATPIINHPEVAILGMYKIQDRLVSHLSGKNKSGEKRASIVSKKYMNFSITCDHRLIDGAEAAQFMKSFVKRIENPSSLFVEMI